MPKQSQGPSDQQQEALTTIGKMMGPQTDSFDDEVSDQLNAHHQAEHDATDYEKEFAEIPHERGYAKMHAAQTSGSEGLGPTEAEATLAKQRAALQQQAAGARTQQAAQAQGQMSPPATPPAAPAGPQGSQTPYPAQQAKGAIGGAGQAPPGTEGAAPPPEAPGGDQGQQQPT